MPSSVHWDEIESETEEVGPIGGTWWDLGAAAGAAALGVCRIRIPAGKMATPLHAEEEEVFFVLAGGGWSVQEDGCFAIGAGDVVLYRRVEPAHTVVAGEDGLEVLAFGTRWPEFAALRLPRLEAAKVGPGLVLRGDTTHQWDLEAALGPIEVADPPDPRPATIVDLAGVPVVEFSRGPARARGRLLARHLGMRRIALNHAELAPGGEAAPPHCHSHEEELFVVLAGGGVLLLGAEEAEHPVRAGSVVARPAGTGVAHAFRAGEGGMALLMFSDKHPGDMAFYPRSGKVALRGLGITIRPEIVPWGD